MPRRESQSHTPEGISEEVSKEAPQEVEENLAFEGKAQENKEPEVGELPQEIAESEPEAIQEKIEEKEQTLSEEAKEALERLMKRCHFIEHLESENFWRRLSRPGRRSLIKDLDLLYQEHEALCRKIREDFKERNKAAKLPAKEGIDLGSLDLDDAHIISIFAQEEDLPLIERFLKEERIRNDFDPSVRGSLLHTLICKN